MAWELGRPDSPSAATLARARRDLAESELFERLHAMRQRHLNPADGVERTAYVLVDELRDEGMRCEQVLLALKALVNHASAHPGALLTELVPLCIIYYYAPASRREA